MAQHPSLRSKDKDKKHRSVLKRYERVKELKKKEKWKDGESVFGLQKLKIVKFKLKKEKAAPAASEAEVASEAAEATAEGTAKTQVKETPKKEEKKK